MEPDCYKIDILHFKNPHLIWAEVQSPNQKTAKIFEQLGLYGILAVESVIDLDNDSIYPVRCEEWSAGVYKAMDQLLAQAVEVWFSTIHIDRRSSLLENNIHKYGEITFKTKTGQIKKLSQLLVKSGLACFDESAFYTELKSSKLQTVLTQDEVQKVKSILKISVNNDEIATSASEISYQVHSSLQKNGNMLTVANVGRHEQLMASKKNVKDEIVSKYFDQDRFKDEEADEVSVGKGCSRSKARHTSCEDASTKLSEGSVLSKRLETYKKKAQKQQKGAEFLEDAKQKLIGNLEKYKIGFEDLDSISHVEDKNLSSNEYSGIMDTEYVTFKTHDEVLNLDSISQIHVNEHSPNNEYSRMLDAENVRTESNDVVLPDMITHVYKKASKKSKSGNIPPDYDVFTQLRIGYGPPDIDRSTIPLKVISKDEQLNPQINDDQTNTQEDVNVKENVFAKMDSEVEFPITSNKVLTQFVSSQIVDQKPVESPSAKSKLTDIIKPESALSKRLRIAKELKKISASSTSISDADTSVKDTSESLNYSKSFNHYTSSEEEDAAIKKKISTVYKKAEEVKKNSVTEDLAKADMVNYVNPFRNFDESLSKFTDKIVSPILLVHSKENKPIQPKCEVSQINFSGQIHSALHGMKITKPMLLQSISWFTILRGNSFFMVSPMNSGKTLGYLPAVCRIVADFDGNEIQGSVGPVCIIVCATALSVNIVVNICRRLLSGKKVLYCYAGIDELKLTQNLLNGCEILVSTPSFLTRLMNIDDFGVDLKRLGVFVLDDFERLNDVYLDEVKFFSIKIKEMLKNRVNKILKVQYIVASRIWCSYMETLATKSPMPIVCIGSFQECVLYSKSPMSINLVESTKKIEIVIDFLSEVDMTKKTVIVCRNDDEVAELEIVLKNKKYFVYAADHNMTTETCCALNNNWSSYDDPVTGAILVCVDYNLNLLNVTDACNLVNYSLPTTFSYFCRRFSVLVDNYPSIFKNDKPSVRIKTLLDETNTEQLPKILNFLKRCSADIPPVLDKECERILKEKDLAKAKQFIPLCNKILAFGECPDYWDCIERHTVFKEYDEPASWVPKNGVVNFSVIHYHSAVSYSARLISNNVNGELIKIPQTYMKICIDMGFYYSNERNKVPHGIPKLGDVCAVAIQENFFKRCQIIKILSKYDNGKPNLVLVRLIDEEKLEKTRDVYLYHLPDKLMNIQPQVVSVQLANVKPKDKDITFSDLARKLIKSKTENKEDLYFRANVVMVLGNNIFVQNMEACQNLAAINKTVVLFNVKEELMKAHAMTNPDHIFKLKELCKDSGVNFESTKTVIPETKPVVKLIPKPRWAHLNEDFQSVYFASAENPGKFFIRLEKFDDCLELLSKDIQKYVSNNNVECLTSVDLDDLVLAKFDDGLYYRARVDKFCDENKISSFFVDHGDWRDVYIKELYLLTENFINRLPFQAIECKLIGLKPINKEWNEYSTNWFCDQFFENPSNLKDLYVKYYSKEIAECTGGHKYGVVIIDTTTDADIVINKVMLDCNLASEDEDGIHYLDELGFQRKESIKSDSEEDLEDKEYVSTSQVDFELRENNEIVPISQDDQSNSYTSSASMLFRKPIRSVPLVAYDNDEDYKRWEVNMTEDEFKSIIKTESNDNSILTTIKNNLPKLPNVSAIDSSSKICEIEDSTESKIVDEVSVENTSHCGSSNKLSIDISSRSDSSNKDFVVFNPPKVQELDSDDLSVSELSVDNLNVQELTPKVYWSQNKFSVILKINLIGVEKYTLDIQSRSLKFSTQLSDSLFGFQLELYGMLNIEKCTHAAKGLYVFVKLIKLKAKLWQNLTQDEVSRKWIVYDPDALVVDSSDDGSDGFINASKEAVKSTVANYDLESYTDSDDEEFIDDTALTYKDYGINLD